MERPKVVLGSRQILSSIIQRETYFDVFKENCVTSVTEGITEPGSKFSRAFSPLLVPASLRMFGLSCSRADELLSHREDQLLMAPVPQRRLGPVQLTG